MELRLLLPHADKKRAHVRNEDPRPARSSSLASSGHAGRPSSGPRVAIVHEWLVTCAGSERVVQQLLRIFRRPSCYRWSTSSAMKILQAFSAATYQPHDLHPAPARGARPGSARPAADAAGHRAARPLALRHRHSSSHAVAKGVLTGPDQMHSATYHSPIRYAWTSTHQYLKGRTHPQPAGWLAKAVPHYMRHLGRAHRARRGSVRGQLQLHRPPHRQGVSARGSGHLSAGRHDALHLPRAERQLLRHRLADGSVQDGAVDRRGLREAARAPAGGDRRRSRVRQSQGPCGAQRGDPRAPAGGGAAWVPPERARVRVSRRGRLRSPRRGASRGTGDRLRQGGALETVPETQAASTSRRALLGEQRVEAIVEAVRRFEKQRELYRPAACGQRRAFSSNASTARCARGARLWSAHVDVRQVEQHIEQLSFG